MYALLLPSAHNFISAVEENVNVLVRAIGVPTPTPTPCLFPSPACTAFVWGPRGREGAVARELVVLREDVVFIVPPFCNRLARQQAPIWAAEKLPAPSARGTCFDCGRSGLHGRHFVGCGLCARFLCLWLSA